MRHEPPEDRQGTRSLVHLSAARLAEGGLGKVQIPADPVVSADEPVVVGGLRPGFLRFEDGLQVLLNPSLAGGPLAGWQEREEPPEGTFDVRINQPVVWSVHRKPDCGS